MAQAGIQECAAQQTACSYHHADYHLGVASILVGGGFANYTYVGLREMAARDSGHLIIAHQDYFTKDEETSMQYGLSNYQALAEGLRADEHIRYILPRIEFSG